MRPIDRLLPVLLAQIPEDIWGRESLEMAFKNIMGSAPYTAPEAYGALFDRATEALQTYLPITPDIKDITELPEWHQTVMKIYNAELDFKDFE